MTDVRQVLLDGAAKGHTGCSECAERDGEHTKTCPATTMRLLRHKDLHGAESECEGTIGMVAFGGGRCDRCKEFIRLGEEPDLPAGQYHIWALVIYSDPVIEADLMRMEYLNEQE